MVSNDVDAAKAEYRQLYERLSAMEQELAQLGRHDVDVDHPDHLLKQDAETQASWWEQVRDLEALRRETREAWHRYESAL